MRGGDETGNVDTGGVETADGGGHMWLHVRLREERRPVGFTQR